jgi:hypothetical protein
VSAESSFKFFGHSNRRFCEKHNVSSLIRAKIPSGITSNRLLEASSVVSLFNDWISEGMLDLHNHTNCCTSHALPSGSRLNTLSDNVSTERQVQRQRPAGNSERLLWLMLAADISEVHRKPASAI